MSTLLLMAIDEPIYSRHLSSLVCTGRSLDWREAGRGLTESQALGASSKSRKEEGQQTIQPGSQEERVQTGQDLGQSR